MVLFLLIIADLKGFIVQLMLIIRIFYIPLFFPANIEQMRTITLLIRPLTSHKMPF